ncbi:MAG: PilZ domain-containing protein [Leptospiraceae bacterium]|nr:PilZ domain-containing protein [Leptospiraceae bacterium]MCP5497877.1 PilZ domain-containing protein [Leptospiraceae bacterium]
MRKYWVPFVFGILILFLPVTYYYSISLKYEESFFLPIKVLKRINISDISLLFTALFSGIGLLMLKKWGWYLFIIPISLLVHNAIYFSKYPNAYNVYSLIHTSLLLLAIMVFLQRDIFLPYIKRNWHGFRREERYLIETVVKINEADRMTENISSGGMLVSWLNCEIPKNQEVSLSFELGGELFVCKGGIVAVQEENVNIAFRNIDKKTQKRLKKCLRSLCLQYK